jgi:hypothetical protein
VTTALGSFNPEVAVPASQVQTALAGARRVVFLDDDPTGTQTVRDLPVLTRWALEDVVWALQQPTPGFFILTNTRSLGPDGAAARDHEIVDTCLRAAKAMGIQLTFASRGDSTLRAGRTDSDYTPSGHSTTSFVSFNSTIKEQDMKPTTAPSAFTVLPPRIVG